MYPLGDVLAEGGCVTSPGGMLSDAFPAGVQAAIGVDRQAKITQFGVNITPEFNAMHLHNIPYIN